MRIQNNTSTEVENISEQLKKSVEVVSAPWKDSPYYQEAEKWLHIFWGQGTVFQRMFEKLDLSHVVELAAGHGRHAELVAKKAGELVVIDVFEDNLNVCRQRLKKYSNVTFRICEGSAFDGIEDGWASSIYCYDAMVHFSPDIVKSYLKDSYRILRAGGRALYHHSNYLSLTDRHYGLNPGARNHMTKKLFAEICDNANVHVLESLVINWAGNSELDCVTLVEKV